MPHVERNDEGRDVWVLDGTPFSSPGLTAVAGWPEPFPAGPKTYEECHPASYDADARLRYMDEVGIWAQVLYPNVAGFGSQRFLKIRDDELKLVCVRAYNDFLRDWASADARRLLTIMTMPFWDIDEAVKEVERNVDKGHRGILFTGEPHRFGLPYLGEAHWDPLWSIAQEAQLPIHFHIGSGEMTSSFGPERIARYGTAATYAYTSVEMFLKNGLQCADLITSGVLPRFPDLKFVSVESGIGWIPFVLEAADHSYLEGRPGRKSEWELLPSEYFARQVYSTLLVRAGGADQAPRGDPGRAHPLRDRLPAPDLPLRQRAREDRDQPRRRHRRAAPADPLGERGRALRRGGAGQSSVTRAPKADGSDSDVVLPHISTCDHDQSSARPWRPTGAGKPSRCTRRSSTVRALFRPSRAATSWASTSSSPSVSSTIESLLPSGSRSLDARRR